MMAEDCDRALGSLYGLAIGDALGMPTQMLNRARVKALFPHFEDFYPGPQENSISRGQPAGKVTDDTEQALILARLLIAGQGQVDSRKFVQALLKWAQMAEQDGSDQLGPSSRRALEAMQYGVPPEESGRYGHTNGAAMRIAPVGIAARFISPSRWAAMVADTVHATHNTGLAISGASAVAAAISQGIEGASFEQQCESAILAAEQGAQQGYYAAGASVARRLSWSLELIHGLDWPSAADLIVGLIGTGIETQESVPAAFAVWASAPDDPWTVCLRAASLGGDSDTIAAMAGAMAGSRAGAKQFPKAARIRIETVNHLKLAKICEDLMALRLASRSNLGK
jgi:ADP-ribosylglycohydrolase